MRLAVITHKTFYRDGDGNCTSYGGFGRTMEELAKYFDEVVLAAPVGPARPEEKGYSIARGNVKVLPLPFYEKGGGWSQKLRFLLFSPLIAWKLLRVMRASDLVHPRIPSYVGLLGLVLVKMFGKPAFVWIGGDWDGKMVETNNSIARRFAAPFLRRLLSTLCRGVPCFVSGKHLYEKYSKGSDLLFRSTGTTVLEEELDARPSRARKFPGGKARILFVGRLDPVKGLEYLLDAVSRIREKGITVELSIAGEGRRDRLERVIRSMGLGDVVKLLGYVPLGGGLEKLYKTHDVLVLPSLSEGTPKVLLEAMARSLPVIASGVGGIPSMVEDGEEGLLVPSRDPGAISEGILKLMNDEGLRRKIIRKALKKARSRTLGKTVAGMMRSLRDCFPSFPVKEFERKGGEV